MGDGGWFDAQGQERGVDDPSVVSPGQRDGDRSVGGVQEPFCRVPVRRQQTSDLGPPILRMLAAFGDP